MSGLYIVQVAICICFMDGFDGQPLYEDKCHVDEMDRRFNGAYNREVVLQRQIGRLKNQLDSFRETIERLQFHLGCLDENGTYLEENVTKSQYCFIKAPFNWKNAKGKCQSFGSHLLEINTESEQKWLYDKVSSSEGMWWIGLVLHTVEHLWIWDHSESASTLKYWHPAEPNGEGREKCALVKKDGRWRDYPCTSKFYFICERK
ncbi:CD209 antigen-like protein C isoform X1 [Magallana gigas]|uniref:C-type lectin domain-containing protein n=1 Tax=Magallana gigas TaxID=29159 RepID=A0A8W8NWJ3_MAGGI|nr:CD209 antigen-like protein C isoform X1 [Crassostrea gigas]